VRTLQRRCIEVLGKSPLDYFQDLRVEHARTLIQANDLDIEAIAAEVGYIDGATLRQLLRQRLGRGVRELKVFAIASIVKPITPEQRQQVMATEVPQTLQLYLDGKIEQMFFRQDAPGVVFLMNVESVEHARTAVSALPLTAGGYAKYELIPVGPLAPLGLLIQQPK
jgi:AraC-like DNA-binding protein